MCVCVCVCEHGYMSEQVGDNEGSEILCCVLLLGYLSPSREVSLEAWLRGSKSLSRTQSPDSVSAMCHTNTHTRTHTLAVGTKKGTWDTTRIYAFLLTYTHI